MDHTLLRLSWRIMIYFHSSSSTISVTDMDVTCTLLGKPHLTTGPASIPVTASSSSSGRPPSSSQVPLAPSGSSAGSSSLGTNNGQTPSPSDSAVGDLETILKEKDTEINYLRETMEQNEQVIFKVDNLQLVNITPLAYSLTMTQMVGVRGEGENVGARAPQD